MLYKNKPPFSSKINLKTGGQKKKISLDFNFPSIELLEKPKTDKPKTKSLK